MVNRSQKSVSSFGDTVGIPNMLFHSLDLTEREILRTFLSASFR